MPTKTLKEDYKFLILLSSTILFSIGLVAAILTVFPEKTPPRPSQGSLLDFLNPDLVARYENSLNTDNN